MSAQAIRSRQSHLLSFEHGRSLADFEILAFSISFETDYLNVLTMLRMAGIPPRRADRAGRNYPLIIAGGSAVFLNPEPIADFIDLFLIGEGEEMVPEFLDRYVSERARTDGSRSARRLQLAGVGGAYLPDYFDPASRRRGQAERGALFRSRRAAGEAPPASMISIAFPPPR